MFGHLVFIFFSSYIRGVMVGGRFYVVFFASAVFSSFRVVDLLFVLFRSIVCELNVFVLKSV